jgi:hypothetical protein
MDIQRSLCHARFKRYPVHGKLLHALPGDDVNGRFQDILLRTCLKNVPARKSFVIH